MIKCQKTRTFLLCKDILDDLYNFKGLFEGQDLVLKFRLELGLGWGISFSVVVKIRVRGLGMHYVN